MKVAIIGYGIEGRSAARYWLDRGHQVVIHDRRDISDPPAGVAARVGPDYLTDLDGVDLLVRSPSVRPDELPDGIPVTSVVAEFLRHSPAPIIGVTGTKGKGTTCGAIAAIARADGRRVFVGGNIGTVPLEFLPQIRPDDVVVLELSSFQLLDLTVSPHLAVVLAVTPDHLDWHRGVEEYYRAKEPIASHQRPEDVVVYDATSPAATRIAETSPGRRIPLRAVDSVSVPLLGAHNRTNVAAAATVAKEVLEIEDSTIREAVQQLAPLPHRLNVVDTVNDVTYVDDSLSTTPEATLAAMAAFDAPKIVILGGSGKGANFEELAFEIASSGARGVLLTGAESSRIAEALDRVGFARYEQVTGSMGDLVVQAEARAEPGDVVLLSPGCASYGQFRDYADRGDQFRAAVQELRD